MTTRLARPLLQLLAQLLRRFVVGLLFEDFIDQILRVGFAVGQRKSFGEGDLEVGVFGFEFEGGFQLGDGAVVVFEAAVGFAEEAVDVGVEDIDVQRQFGVLQRVVEVPFGESHLGQGLSRGGVVGFERDQFFEGLAALGLVAGQLGGGGRSLPPVAVVREVLLAEFA